MGKENYFSINNELFMVLTFYIFFELWISFNCIKQEKVKLNITMFCFTASSDKWIKLLISVKKIMFDQTTSVIVNCWQILRKFTRHDHLTSHIVRLYVKTKYKMNILCQNLSLDQRNKISLVNFLKQAETYVHSGD